ncbi:MAG: hypothetical protein ABUL44_01820 [Flavobacterium sp.]
MPVKEKTNNFSDTKVQINNRIKKKLMEDINKPRRGFLKWTAAALAIVGIAVATKQKVGKTESKKIKMLTPDGRLVEVDEAAVTNATSHELRATNKEIQQWMKTSKV